MFCITIYTIFRKSSDLYKSFEGKYVTIRIPTIFSPSEQYILDSLDPERSQTLTVALHNAITILILSSWNHQETETQSIQVNLMQDLAGLVVKRTSLGDFEQG